jgi:anaerobic magnesium-protoporphyrin IX monomethyl ester cyclase
LFVPIKMIMSNSPVVFVAFKEFDNLGVGYLASVLTEEHYEPLIIDFSDGKEEILKNIKKLNPLIVGFSVIFQYYIYEFKELINYLRESGVNSHFSVGGQYASMRYNDLFNLIPSIDSIVRFEGEYTFLELVNCIHSGTDWRKIKGLAYKENGKFIVNQLRPPEMDLDKFPFPIRSAPRDYVLGKKFATILAGRGCSNNCSFCNNTEYIKQSSAQIKRIRNPEKVVEEIDFLHHKKQCSVFLFEDDDFPVETNNGFDWIERFCNELKRKRLTGKIMWKISCRTNEVDLASFSLMKDHGLFLVFLGIDDGTDSGLARLNKHMTVAESLRGINILKELEIGFDYGFMLFQPASTFESVNHNLNFLRQLSSDGTTPVTFLKLMPFFDTRVEKELGKEGRLKGEPGFLDYDFLDNSLNNYYEFVNDSFMEWIHDSEGLSNVLKWARNYFLVFDHFYKFSHEVELLSSEVKKRVVQSNIFILDTLMELSDIFEKEKYDNAKFSDLNGYRVNIKENHDKFKEQTGTLIRKLCRIAEYQELLQVIKY